jgi:predicted AAA+ superfamily ATPase
MDELLEISNQLIHSVSSDFTRNQLVQDAYSERLLAIQGYRGTGKTTLILQHMRALSATEKVAYLSLDHFYFQQVPMYEVVKQLYQWGYRTVALDEVHKYPDWSRQIKSLYDSYRDLKMIFSGSSVLEIYRSAADLSRRAVSKNMPVLSLREFIEMKDGIKVPVVSLEDLLMDHMGVAAEIHGIIKSPLMYFSEYLRNGSYPVFTEGLSHYHQKLMRTGMLVIDTDITAVTNMSFQSVQKIKKLLGFIAQAVPYKPNISEMAAFIEAKRETVLVYMDLLHRAGLIRSVSLAGKTMGPLSKPEKIYLDNPNLCYALGLSEPNVGTLRETFVLSQLSFRHKIQASVDADFIVDDRYTLEIGGKNKNKKQIKRVKNAWVVADNLEIGNAHSIPLWLFGFLY